MKAQFYKWEGAVSLLWAGLVNRLKPFHPEKPPVPAALSGETRLRHQYPVLVRSSAFAHAAAAPTTSRQDLSPSSL